ncbi:unnamed protein product [Ranitomeya imitator]|uniref:Acyl-CoA thioester hydrolase/bile acid-CoA amino acid N-acetyltransferase domain-containing protein n=1 Tax=Ranitomeya imitator TaxID=111125 RepID=A0ABN9LNH0_9NEOB|nr:unnamed protein product [Ranitomeya imitator]
MVGLTVSPEISLMDEPVKIQAWGLPPDQVITLAAWLKDEKGLIFHSRAFYKTDMEGKVDLEKTPATGGDFHGVCPMGLFWALKPKIPFKKLNKRDVVGSPFLVHIELYSSLELNVSEDCPAATKVIERWYAAPGVQRISIREGRIRGALFLPPGEGPFLGIIDMFGGIGGLQVFRSSLLASRGFASLALAYLAYDDLPKVLHEVDLKYFEEAAQFLCNHPKASDVNSGLSAGQLEVGQDEIACSDAQRFEQPRSHEGDGGKVSQEVDDDETQLAESQEEEQGADGTWDGTHPPDAEDCRP